jgi:hypothetical protein
MLNTLFLMTHIALPHAIAATANRPNTAHFHSQ